MPLITVVIASTETTRAACLRLLRPVKQIRVVAEARSDREAIAAAGLNPRILLLDMSVSIRGGLVVLRAFRRDSPRTKVILLTRRGAEARILDALSHGARGHLERKALRRFLAKAVRLVDAGEAWVPRKMVAKLIVRFALATARAERR